MFPPSQKEGSESQKGVSPAEAHMIVRVHLELESDNQFEDITLHGVVLDFHWRPRLD